MANLVVIDGFLAGEPKQIRSDSGNLTFARLCHTQDHHSLYLDLVARRQNSDWLATFKKGDLVLVEGELSFNANKQRIEVETSKVQLLKRGNVDDKEN